ncbi:MAG: hypothetical protein J6C26_07285 [Clostridia bacterium]|nr:hypothetical protein [Clostridia bacterium]
MILAEGKLNFIFAQQKHHAAGASFVRRTTSFLTPSVTAAEPAVTDEVASVHNVFFGSILATVNPFRRLRRHLPLLRGGKRKRITHLCFTLQKVTLE